MRVLVVIRHSPAKRFLVKLHNKELIDEVKSLIGKSRNSTAIVTALSKGRFEQEVSAGEASSIETDLILTEESAHWSITK